jgi:hypothetical protein
MSDDYQGTITRLLGILKNGDNDAKSKAIEKLWNVYIDRLCEIARVTLTKEAARASSDQSMIQSVFDSLQRRAQCGELVALSHEDGLWKYLLESINRKAAKLSTDAQPTDTSEINSTTVPSHVQLSLQEAAFKEPTADGIQEILQKLDGIEGDITRNVVLLHLQSYTDQQISERLKISQRSVHRKIALVKKMWEN